MKRIVSDTIAADLPCPDLNSEKAQDELLRLTDASARSKPENTFGNLDSRRILYYPGAGRDFTPLFRLTHLYDTFIYADYGVDADCGVVNPDLRDLAGWIEKAVPGKTGLKVTDIKHLLVELLQRLGRDPIHEPAPRPDRNRENAAWGAHVRLTRRIGPVERPIDLFYLGLEGVTVYRNLFAKACTAPRGVCFISTDGFAGNHTQFGSWSKCFGAVVRQNPRKPEFLMHANGIGDDDWPWNNVWQRHPNWSGMKGGTITSYTLPAASVSGTETPEIPQVQQNHLPTPSGFEVVVRRGFQPPAGAQVVSRDDVAPSLEKLLSHQTTPADRPLATELHCILKGFEDEGCMLERGLGSSEQQLTLFIYGDDDGDVASFAPYCSRVESLSGVAPLDPRPR